MSGQELKSCGGCGEVDPSKRCMGCFHDFGDDSSAWVRKTTRTPDPAQIRADALREAVALVQATISKRSDQLREEGEKSHHHRNITQMIRWQAGKVQAELLADAIRALIDAPLSPTAVDGSPAPDAGGNADPAVYLIRKYGGYYRPNCQGYTRFKEDAGRYTLAEAIRESHPNGPDGPRDGMTYIHENDVLPFDAGGKEDV